MSDGHWIKQTAQSQLVLEETQRNNERIGWC